MPREGIRKLANDDFKVIKDKASAPSAGIQVPVRTVVVDGNNGVKHGRKDRVRAGP